MVTSHNTIRTYPILELVSLQVVRKSGFLKIGYKQVISLPSELCLLRSFDTQVSILFFRWFTTFLTSPTTLLTILRSLLTVGQKATFYPEITKNLMFEKCEFCEKWDFENMNFVKIEISELWILWKMRLQKCEFCEKNEISEMWIL